MCVIDLTEAVGKTKKNNVITIIIRNEYYYSAVSQKELREHLTAKNISLLRMTSS